MFGTMTPHYSLFDHVSTFGGDLIWRPRALWQVDRLLDRPPERILDVGCGPGDLTLLLPRHYPRARVIGVDFTREMVERAARDARSTGEERAQFVRGDALHLPFETGTFDLVTSAFLLRNLPDLAAGLKEMARVLRPGGVVLALDVTEPGGGAFGRFFHAYFDTIVPVIGTAFGLGTASRYLARSIRQIPPRPEVVRMLQRVGFSTAIADPQWMGIVTGFLGRVGVSSGAP